MAEHTLGCSIKMCWPAAATGIPRGKQHRRNFTLASPPRSRRRTKRRTATYSPSFSAADSSSVPPCSDAFQHILRTVLRPGSLRLR